MTVFDIKNGNDYTESYYNKKTNFEVGYYSVNEMKALYPDGGIRVVGQIAHGKEQKGTITVNGIEEVVYRPLNSARYKTIGYIELEGDKYITVKKDNILALILLMVLALLVLAGLVLGIKYLITNSDSEETTTTTKPMIMVGDAQEGEGVWDKLEDKVDVSAKNITMRGVTTINFKAGTTKQNYIFTNDKKNEGICFMQFTLYLDKNEDGKIDSGDEQLYQSGALQPGYSISYFDISRPLNAGTYKAIVMAQPYSQDKAMTKLNNMVFKTEIVVSEAE